MCGIICIISKCEDGNFLDLKYILPEEIEKSSHRRGPDHTNSCTINSGLIFSGSVLRQQGHQFTAQPVISEKFIILFNGDIFNANKDDNISDTFWLKNQLEQCVNDIDILNLFKTIKGPYSVIFYNKITDHLYFFRDSLGRNSLLIEKDQKILRILSTSCITNSNKITMELPSIGIFKLNVNKMNEIDLFPWKVLTENNLNLLEDLKKQFQFIITTKIRDPIEPEWLISNYDGMVESNYDFMEIITNMNDQNLFMKLLQYEKIAWTVNKLTQLLENSIKDRILTTPPFCNQCIRPIRLEDFSQSSQLICNHSKIAILFSGGIDCTILAALANKYVKSTESIDLINVAFESVKRNNDDKLNWDVPDRQSAIQSYNELKKLFPLRTWNLIEVNVTRDELDCMLKNHIRHLIYPLKTVLDESLGCAFWFAARGKGLLNGCSYQNNSRIILLGSGADELFGGYTRHRNAYIRHQGDHLEKLEALRNELQMDWERIPSRNLARDDRVIGDHGRTARAPFIQENIVKFVQNLKPNQKCLFNANSSGGDKLLLRLCGFNLGLLTASTFKKRAIQFGSRIANKNQNAKDISENLIS